MSSTGFGVGCSLFFDGFDCVGDKSGVLARKLVGWLERTPDDPSVPSDREAYHSDLRASHPDAWARRTPLALGCDVEQAMLLTGVTSRDFASVIGIELTPHVSVPVDIIVDQCRRHARACTERAQRLCAMLPPPNPWGRPPLPCHRRQARQATSLYRAAAVWSAFAHALLTNRW